MHILSDTPHSGRAKIFKLHRENKIQILIGCGVFREGYDNPPDKIIFNLCPTLSAVVKVQSSGRGMRNFPGKKCAYVLNSFYEIKQLLFRDFPEGNYCVGLNENTQPLYLQ